MTSASSTPSPKPASRRVSRWGEGPFWHENVLWYVDIEGHGLIRFDPSCGTEQVWNMGERIGFARPRAQGGLVWGGDKGLYLFDPAIGASQQLPDTAPESPEHRYNDAGTSPDGLLFAGTISLRKQSGSANLYRLDAGRKRSLVYPGVTNSNGIGWSPDGTRCFYIDTPTQQVLRFDYAEGILSKPRPFIDTRFTDASPDGLCVDRDGHLWIAFCHGGCVIRFDGHDGRQLCRIDFPCVETTACCFGGQKYEDLYVTTGLHKTLQEDLAGRLFVVEGLGTGGLPLSCFAG